MKNVYVHDDLFTEDELNTIEMKCISAGEETLSDDLCGGRVFETEHYYEIDFLSLIRDKGVIPQNLNYRAWTFRIRQTQGAYISEHTDEGKLFAMSLYLNECKGGDLHVIDKDTNEEHVIQPRRNRLVVLVSNNLHWTTPVESGERKSIQMFVNYIF